MTDYTPTTERVRDTWTNAMSEGCASDEELADAQWDTERRDAQFDRWLAAHDAEVCGRYVPSVAQVDAFVKAINDNGFVLDRGAVLSGLIAAAAVSDPQRKVGE